MQKLVFVGLLILLSLRQGLSQKVVTTLSGQNILILNDSTWQKVEKKEEKPDSTGLLINDLQPMSLPQNHELTETEKGFLELMLKAAQLKEIETFLTLDYLDKESAINGIATSQAKLVKDKDKENTIKKEGKLLKSKISDVTKTYQLVAKHIASIKNIESLKPTERAKKIKEYAAIYLTADNQPVDQNEALPVTGDTKPKTVTTSKTIKIPYCNIVSDTIVNKRRAIITESSPLFSYTPEKLKGYFKLKELMEVNCNIEKTGKDYFLILTIRIMSKDAAKNYGLIQKGNILRVNFISGKSAILNAYEEEQSKVESYTGHSVYTVYYPISNEDADIFSNVPLDTMGIMWSSGFELYDIYNVDTIMKQLACIKSVSK